jgi:hypothetical protein
MGVEEERSRYSSLMVTLVRGAGVGVPNSQRCSVCITMHSLGPGASAEGGGGGCTLRVTAEVCIDRFLDALPVVDLSTILPPLLDRSAPKSHIIVLAPAVEVSPCFCPSPTSACSSDNSAVGHPSISPSPTSSPSATPICAKLPFAGESRRTPRSRTTSLPFG